MSQEALTSVNLNFGGGSNHTASTTSVIGAKDLGKSNKDSLGTVTGPVGKRVDFSNTRLGDIFNQFVVTEKTTIKDGTKTIIQRKYTDRISLLLKANCIIVRGKDCGPRLSGLGSFQGLVADFSECTGSPVPSYGQQGAQSFGGATVLGNIYSEISDSVQIGGLPDGQKISLIYQGGYFKPELSHNAQYVPNTYINDPDFSNAVPKYGYTLTELVGALSDNGIPLSGLPSSSNILFENSGTFESVIGSIASSLGMYWYVDPFTGTVQFVSSASATLYDVTDPTKLEGLNITNASYTESALSPVVVNSYMSTTAIKENNTDISERQRIARFRPIDVTASDKASLTIGEDVLGLYYSAAASGSLTDKVFDVLAYRAKETPDFGKLMAKDWEPADKKKKSWQEVIVGPESRQEAEDTYKGRFDLKKGVFYATRSSPSGKWDDLPSKSAAFQTVKDALGLFVNKFYVSNSYSDWKARRMQWGSSDVSISGPYPSDTEIKDIEALKSLAGLVKILKDEKEDAETGDSASKKNQAITIGDLADLAGCTGNGGYHFVGVKAQASLNVPTSSNDFTKFRKEYVEMWSSPQSLSYFGIEEALDKEIKDIIGRSQALYKLRKDKKLFLQTARCPYTRSKTPVNALYGSDGKIDEDSEDALDKNDAGSGRPEGQINDLFDKFNYVDSKIQTNGSSGDPLVPVTLDVKKGKGAEIKALIGANFGGRSSKKRLKSSSRTMVGLVVPEFSIIISGISIQLNSGGITTTITESTKKLLPVDTDILVTLDGKSVKASNNPMGGFSAGQRNAFDL